MAAAEEAVASFRMLLLTLLGQALTAADYALEEDEVSQASGRFRFHHLGSANKERAIEFQLLAGVANEWAPQMPSRFRVTLIRADQRRTLGALVVTDFDVPILPSAEHWWDWRDSVGLGAALAEAGHLLVGYGIPWLAGELEPPP